MALFWFPLHMSSYYPISLALSAPDVSEESIILYHVVYSVVLVCLIVSALLARRALETHFESSRSLSIAAMLCGCAGTLLFLFSRQVSEALAAMCMTMGIVLIAIYVVCSTIMWGARLARLDARSAFTCGFLSYAIFNVLFGIATVFDFQEGILSVAPVLSGLCLVLLICPAPREPAMALADLRGISRSFLVAAVVLIWLGMFFVKLLTLMQVGVTFSGRSTTYHLITALSALVIALLLAALAANKKSSMRLVPAIAFSVLVLAYLATFLLTILGLEADALSFVGKRIMVGSEHCVEVLLFVMCATIVGRRNISSTLIFGLYILLAMALPQVIANDLISQAVLPDSIFRSDWAVPLVAIASFVVACVAVLVFVSHSIRSDTRKSAADEGAVAAPMPLNIPENWDELLCGRALDGLDLTPREFDVALCAYRGMSARKTAELLFVSTSTVKTHTSHLYAKLDIHTKQDLIEYINSYR